MTKQERAAKEKWSKAKEQKAKRQSQLTTGADGKPKGSKGIKGNEGSKGIKGSEGSKGIKGNEGSKRIKGNEGSKGSEASYRSRGRSTNEKGSFQRSQSREKKVATADEVVIGDVIIVTIKRIGINGEGVGYYKRKAVFVEGAITNEVVKAKITKVERSYLHADIVEIEKRSSKRQEPPCPVYTICGGCQLQHMTYEAQLEAKEEIVREAFNRYTPLEKLPLRAIYGMDDPWHYRNKAQLQLGYRQDHQSSVITHAGRGNRSTVNNSAHKNKWNQSGSNTTSKELISGLYAANSHHLIDISECTIHDEAINVVYKKLKQMLVELEIEPYDERARSGYIKTIVVRVAKTSGKLQVTFVTATDVLPQHRLLVERIRKELPEVITVAHNIHKERSSIIFGPKTSILWGEERLPETLGNIQFALSPRAFFQLNPKQTIKLYDAVKEAASLTGQELVVDAYCGTGTISLWLAELSKEVRGVEIIAQAVEDARSNAQYSGIGNALFYEGKAEELLPHWVEDGLRPDVIVVDPPRTGLDPAFIQAVLHAQPKRFVYVSCNPSTLAKDCKELLGGGYRLEWVQPLDMFPKTAQVESVSLLIFEGRP